MAIGELYKTADFKAEKHVPVIEAADSVAVGSPLEVKLCVGKEIAHPNTTAHHIRWIKLYFKPEGSTVYEAASLDFTVHGEAVKGADEGPALAEPFGSVTLKLKSSGTLIATSYCNIHGLWESAKEIRVG